MNQDTLEPLFQGHFRKCAKTLLVILFAIPLAGQAQEALENTIVTGAQDAPAPRSAPAPVPVQPAPAPEPVLVEPDIELNPLIINDEVTALRTPTPLIDVPQSVTIFSERRIQDQGITRLSQIVDYTPGVSNTQGEGHRDAIVIRGQRTTADFYLDGVRDDVQYYRSLYNIERVEILRGASALTFGRGGTGGVINRVTKKPVIGYNFTNFDASVNTFGAVGVQFDWNQTVGESSYMTGGKGGKQIISTPTSAFRINGFYEHLNNHRDFYKGDRYGINPTVAWELGPDTRLDVSYEYNNHDQFIDRGIPTGANGRPVTALAGTTFGDEFQNYTTFESHSFRAALTHDFSNQWQGRLLGFYGDYDKTYQNFYASGYNQGTNIVTMDGYVDNTMRQNFVLSGDLVGQFDTGAVGHTVLIGAEYVNTSSDQNRNNTFWDTTMSDKENFNAGNFYLGNGSGVNSAGVVANNDFTVSQADDTRVKLDTYSFFLQDEIALNQHLDVVLGARFDSFNIDVFDAQNGVRRTRQDDEVSPRIGVIGKPADNVSIYGAYSKTFLPRSGGQFANINPPADALDPNEFTNLEFGANWDLNPNLSLRTAVFQLEQSSPQVADNNPATFDVIDTETQGFEAELTGFVTDRWFVATGYTYLDGEIVNRLGSTGLRPRELPRHMFSIWNRYDVTERLGLGLGVVCQDESFVNNSNTATLPSYTRVDAAAYYKLNDRYRLQVNIENLFDTQYFPTSHSTHQVTVGAPISAAFTIRGEF